MSRRNYNAFLKAARKSAKRTAGLSLPYKRKALERASARVKRAQVALGSAQTRLAKAKLVEARAGVRATRRDIAATERAGKLTMKQARAAYKKMAAGLNRPLKGTDVRNHPKLFTRSLPTGIRKAFAGRTRLRKAVSKGVAKPKGGAVPRKPEPTLERKRQRVIRTIEELIEEFEQEMMDEDVEYASTAEYMKK